MKKISWLFILFFISFNCLNSQTVDSIIQKYLKAHGGINKVKEMKNLKIEMKAKLDLENAYLTIYIKDSNHIRMEKNQKSKNDIVLISPQGIYKFEDSILRKPTQTEIWESNLYIKLFTMDFADSISYYKAKGGKAQYICIDTIFGKLANKVKFELSSGLTFYFSFDCQSGLITRISGSDDGVIILIITDYEYFNDYNFPSKIEMYNQGRYGGLISFNYPKVKEPLPDSLFDVELLKEEAEKEK